MSRRNPTPGQRRMIRNEMQVNGLTYMEAIMKIPESEPRINGMLQMYKGPLLTNIPRPRSETSRKISYE